MTEKNWSEMTVAEIKSQIHVRTAAETLCLLMDDKRTAVKNLAAKLLLAQEKEQARLESLLLFEEELWQQNIFTVAGIDEAGRGPLAGPVVAAAVVLAPGEPIWGVNDSKKLSATKREEVEAEIKEKSLFWAIGVVGAHDIDKYNILQATKLAMRRAIHKLPIKPDYLLLDAVSLPETGIAQKPIIKGDALSLSIGAASILAKCHRDRMMLLYHEKYPVYGFDRHKGYPTAEHKEMVKKYGYSPIHRKTFQI